MDVCSFVYRWKKVVRPLQQVFTRSHLFLEEKECSSAFWITVWIRISKLQYACLKLRSKDEYRIRIEFDIKTFWKQQNFSKWYHLVFQQEVLDVVSKCSYLLVQNISGNIIVCLYQSEGGLKPGWFYLWITILKCGRKVLITWYAQLGVWQNVYTSWQYGYPSELQCRLLFHFSVCWDLYSREKSRTTIHMVRCGRFTA